MSKINLCVCNTHQPYVMSIMRHGNKGLQRNIEVYTTILDGGYIRSRCSSMNVEFVKHTVDTNDMGTLTVGFDDLELTLFSCYGDSKITNHTQSALRHMEFMHDISQQPEVIQ